MVIRWATVLTAVVTAMATGISPAGAAVPSPYRLADAVGVVAPCGTCIYQRAGDLIAMSASNRATTLKLKFTTRKGVNPFTDPTWSNQHTNATWHIYTGSGTWTYNIFLGDGFAPQVFNLSTGEVACPGASSSYAPSATTAAATYTVTIPKSCLPGMTANLRVQATLSYYSSTSPDVVTFDTAPDNGHTPKIVQAP